MEFFRIALIAVVISLLGACATNPLVKAARYHNQGDYDQAIESFTQLLIDVNNTSKIPKHLIYNYRGISYFNNGQFDQAMADYNKAISLSEDFAPAHHNRGLILISMREYDQALADIDKAIALNPEFFQAYVSRGEIFEMKGQYKRAIGEYDKAVALEPNYVDAYINRGNYYRQIKQYDMAIANYDTAIVLSPNQTEGYANRGFVLFYLDRYIEAAKDFEKVTEYKFATLYGALWYYLAIERQAKNGKAALKEKSQGFDLQQWPGPLVSLYLGEISPVEVIKYTDDKDKKMESQKKCLAYFHVGQYYLLQGKKTLAIEMFKKTASFEDIIFIEFAGALEELERLHQLPT